MYMYEYGTMKPTILHTYYVIIKNLREQEFDSTFGKVQIEDVKIKICLE